MTPRAFLIDGTAFGYRAFYAIRALSTSEGQPTNAVYGFATMLAALRQKERPAYLAVAFDAGKPTFRHARFADYKVQRPSMPEGLIGQLPLIKELLAASRVPVFQLDGFEAEDLLATIAKKIAGKGLEVFLVTGDKDALQLVGDSVKVYNPQKTDEGVIFDARKVTERYGVGPGQMVELMALMGDKIDNIPGVPGVGEKTAAELIKRFGTVEALYVRLDEVASEPLRRSLREHREQVALARELAQIDADAPIGVELSALAVRDPDWAALRRLYRRLEFKRLVAEIDEMAPAATVEQAPAIRIHRVESADAAERFAERLATTVLASIAACRPPAAASGDEADGAADMFGKADSVPPSLVLAVAWDAEEAWLVPVSAASPGRQALATWLASPSAPKVAHDGKRLLGWLREAGLELQSIAGDTLLAGYLLNPATANPTLTELADQWLDERLAADPTPESLSTESGAQALGYRAAIVLRLHETLAKALEQQSLSRLYRDLELPLLRVLAEMERAGIALDTALIESMRVQMAAKLQRLIDELYGLAGSQFNVNSPKQLSEILFQQLKLPVIKRTKTGASTDSDVLKQLAPLHPLPAKLLEVRELGKLVSTYVEALPKLIDPSTKRLHTTFHQTGAATGRLSSSDPNLQNIPLKTELGRQIRKAFVPGEPGWSLLAADYSQIELRLLAHMAADPELRRAFQDGRDIHRHTASLIYGTPEAEVTKEMRSAMKAINFGIIYGMSAHGLSKELGVPHEEAAKFIDAYFARYPKIRAFLDSQIAQARKDGFVQTLLGRRRYIPEVKSSDMALRQFGERMAINAPIQGSAADLIKLAMVRLAEQMRSRKLASRMLLQVHDELVFECPPSERDALASLVRDVMEHAASLSVPIRVVVRSGPNWLDLIEVR